MAETYDRFYEKSTGKWMVDFRNSAISVSDINYGVATLNTKPDATKDRFDVPTQLNRLATPAEIQESIIDRKIIEFKEFDSFLLLKALVIWIAGKLAITPNTAKNEILEIYKTL